MIFWRHLLVVSIWGLIVFSLSAQPTFHYSAPRASLPDTGDHERNIRQYLHQQYLKLFDTLQLSLAQTETKYSLTGSHRHYQQLYQGVPLHQATLKVNIDTSTKTVTSVLYSAIEIEKSDLPSTLDQLKANTHSSVSQFLTRYQNIEYQDSNPCLFWDTASQTLVPGYRVEIKSPSTGHREFLLNRYNEVLSQEDLERYSHPPGTTDSVVSIRIFKPDPLTTADTTYNGSYRDFSDADTPTLNQERTWDSVITTFDQDTFRLENSYGKVVDAEQPNITPAYSLTDTFNFTRQQAGFEEVNALYHVTRYQNYLQSIGFTNLVNLQIRIDAHAHNGADNSSFDDSPPTLYFGEGGVDDAEDADVIVHEYGHAMAYSAAPGTRSGFERKALEEGLGDYIAASYSRHLSPNMWDSVYTWDGWNEFWAGRSASTSKHYPEDLTNSSIHADGEIWSSVMMEIWANLGRDTTNRLLYESLYNWSNNMDMPTAARLVLQTDTLLYNARHADLLRQHFVDRGLLDADSADDTSTIPPADPVSQIEVHNTRRFAARKGPLLIRVPDTSSNVFVELYNLKGQQVYTYQQKNEQTIKLSGLGLSKGMYLIHIRTETHFHHQKIIRLK